MSNRICAYPGCGHIKSHHNHYGCGIYGCPCWEKGGFVPQWTQWHYQLKVNPNE
jgi:hypothetical protein